jgi:hypothetical protein
MPVLHPETVSMTVYSIWFGLKMHSAKIFAAVHQKCSGAWSDA